MSRSKNLSNSFSTGGGGPHFEAHVQASFVALMLTGGYAPCLPCWPIVEIKLQGKVDGFDTDDLIVCVENDNSKERRRLLGQVKHSVSITKKNAVFGEVVQAAWSDFNNPDTFTRGKDVIALITGPLSETDARNAKWLLDQSRHTKSVDEFFRYVRQANFSPSKSADKLEAIQHHLMEANDGVEVSKDELYDFLNHFHLLGYDLGSEGGVVLPLLHSHISQFHQQYPNWAWTRIVDFVQTCNQNAGTITVNNLPEDLQEAFKQKAVQEIPIEFKSSQEVPKTDWSQYPDATYLALVVLIGAWEDKGQCDLEAIVKLLGIEYDEWLGKAREMLHLPDSPLSLKNGAWKVVNRAQLWSVLGSRVFDQDLDRFKEIAVSVLREGDPAFELPSGERYLARIQGKVLKHSHVLREGIAEGLAILGSVPEACVNCSQEKAEEVSFEVIREVLGGADWVLWGSLNGLLPTLSEASPGEFLNAVESALRLTPCPFDELFSQEGGAITGSNYLTGLLWALEGLAWDEEYLVRVCVALGELASHDPGGQWGNRPSSSLASILLPWLPQTQASVEKREVAVRTLLNESPDVGWDLVVQLLPGKHQVSSGTHKPKWRKTIPGDWDRNVTQKEYWQQASSYAEMAVAFAGQDLGRLSGLIDNFHHLPKPAFDGLIQALSSEFISGFPEEKRLMIWDRLTRFINEHRRFSDAEWALPEDLVSRIEQVARGLAPEDPFNLHQHLFTNRDHDLYEKNGNWDEQRKKLASRREAAVLEIFQRDGIEGVIRFAESVSSPGHVGHALGAIVDPVIEQALLPRFLDSKDSRRGALVSGYVWRRHHDGGWGWADSVEKSNWTSAHVGQFLSCLPFSNESWCRAADWLQKHEMEYWVRTGANAFQAEGDLAVAVDALVKYERPFAAINCLYRLLYTEVPINTDQCIRALLAALDSSEPGHTRDVYHIVELIKFLQTEPDADQEGLLKVEWAYVPLLDRQGGAAPKLLETRLANDPAFFCEVVQMAYRSKTEDRPEKELTKGSRELATNAWRLLHEWKTPPGTHKDGIFNGEEFEDWLRNVRVRCMESGHLEVALINIGQVLIHVPPDPDGLWIHRKVASALNDRDADDLRDGFRTAKYNSRGAHWVDPTGKVERELAEKFGRMAEEVEDAGYQRFAVCLRDLADGYSREARRIIIDSNDQAGG